MVRTSLQTKHIILFVCLIVCCVTYYYLSQQGLLLPRLFSNDVDGKKTTKSFLYYVQTAACLLEYHLQPDLLGNSSLCDCDVLVLSYRTECLKNNFTHVRYIFSNNTTWTTGRNLLYRRAKTVMDDYNHYIYHTFMDEDLLWNWSEWPHFDANIKLSNVSPMRAYEQFLLRKLPVHGSPFYFNPKSCSTNNNYYIDKFMRAYVCGSQCARTNKTFPSSCLAIGPDAAVGSFHRNVIDKLLPYNEQNDNKSWWVSQQTLFVRLYVRFYKQSLTFLPVAVCNPSHSKYPHGLFLYHDLIAAEKLLSPLSKRNLSIWPEVRSIFGKRYGLPTCHHMLDPTIMRTQNSNMDMYVVDSVTA